MLLYILLVTVEQAIREIYCKPFEIAVKEGGAKGIMSAFNRIGKTWCGGTPELLVDLLRNEWGFDGMVITDAYINFTGHAIWTLFSPYKVLNNELLCMLWSVRKLRSGSLNEAGLQKRPDRLRNSPATAQRVFSRTRCSQKHS